jgi:hypothetical protein
MKRRTTPWALLGQMAIRRALGLGLLTSDWQRQKLPGKDPTPDTRYRYVCSNCGNQFELGTYYNSYECDQCGSDMTVELL